MIMMSCPYTLFAPEVRSWRNRILQAEIEGEVPETHPHWWDGVPLTTPPPPLTFAVSGKGPMLDAYFTGNRFDLYSSRLISVLEEAGVQFETFPATVVDRKTKEPVPVSYQVFHLLEVYPALHVSRATSGPPVIIGLESVPAKWQDHQRPFFRAQEAANLVLIHDHLRHALVAHGISGCVYTPINEYGRDWPQGNE